MLIRYQRRAELALRLIESGKVVSEQSIACLISACNAADTRRLLPDYAYALMSWRHWPERIPTLLLTTSPRHSLAPPAESAVGCSNAGRAPLASYADLDPKPW